MENENNISTNYPNVISGIDTLFYFYQSNKLYDDFFSDLLEELERKKKEFDDKEVSYENRDLKVSINNNVFEFNGRANGFYWFTHLDSFVKVGFKDSKSNQALHNIQIQFISVGIYTLGLRSLLNYVDEIFKNITTGYKPVTRVDLNMFVQTDLSWLNKEMFVSRKRKYTSHLKEICSKYKLQTLYIGQSPFKLRLYDKRAELKNSPKREMMYDYFSRHDINREEDIFNIEFECHRKYLKTFSIDTVDDLLGLAEKLFKHSMDSIRLVSLSTISSNSIDTKNRYKADIHPLWKYISDSYKLKDFLAVDVPLTKLKAKKYLYTVEEAIKEHVNLANRAYMHDVVIDEKFYCEVLIARGKVCKYDFKELYSENKGLTNDSALGVSR